MESKIKIKMGPIEIEYEGSEGFLKEELPALLTAVSDLYRESGVVEESSSTKAIMSEVASEPTEVSGNSFQGTTGTIAGILGVKSGSDLVIAAAARLTIVLGQDTFTRSQIMSEMKSASAYYTKSHSKNLTQILNKLLKGQRLLETAKDTYAMSANEKATVEARFA